MGKSGGAGVGAVIGGVVGSVVPVVGTYAGAAVGGLIGSAFDQAGAENDAANAELNQQMNDRSNVLRYVTPSDMELQQLQQAITINNQDISRKQKLLASSDPALIEAGHQALDLMKGKEAATLAPLKNQRAIQRSQLQQTLAQQLGGDYATTSAGIQALNNFDQGTQNLMTNAQQQTLQSYLGVAESMQGFGNTNNNVAASSALAAQRGAIGVRQAQAIQGTHIDASLNYAGQIAQNAAVGNAFGTMLSYGAMNSSGGQIQNAPSGNGTGYLGANTQFNFGGSAAPEK